MKKEKVKMKKVMKKKEADKIEEEKSRIKQTQAERKPSIPKVAIKKPTAAAQKINQGITPKPCTTRLPDPTPDSTMECRQNGMGSSSAS